MSDFTSAFMPKTDLASEIHEYFNKKSTHDLDGIVCETKKQGSLDTVKVTITTKEGAEKFGKPEGRYTTVNVGRVSGNMQTEFKRKCLDLASVLSEYFPPTGSCLFAGIGNRRITADATGPECADRILVTRHLKSSGSNLFSMMGLRETMCVATDVLGNTGIEAAELLGGVVKDTKPDFIVAVDALATSSLGRLATTVQICDTGISPGSGVNNRRLPITKSTMGVPVFALGIPTVADIVAVVSEIFSSSDLSHTDKDGEALQSACRTALSHSSSARFVTPKDADAIIRTSSKLMAYAVNLALNPGLSYEDMCELVTGV